MNNTGDTARKKWGTKNNRTTNNINRNKEIMDTHIYFNNERFQLRRKDQ